MEQIALLVAGRGLADVARQPVKTFVQTITRGSASGLDEPCATLETRQVQLFGDFACLQRVGQVLLVGKDQQNSIAQFVFRQHAVQFFTGFINTVTVVGVDDEDDTLCVLEVVSPERSDAVLTTNVPHGELDVLVFYGFDVETNGGDSGDDFTQLQFVQNGGLTGGVQTNHQNTHFLVAEESVKELGKG
jgi:hypothetical protein